MDHSKGVQIPEGILPGVSVLKPGLALCLKHSQVDKRYIDSHIELLAQNLPPELYPSFQAKDTATCRLDDAMELLHRLRQSALQGGRVYFIYSPYFAARLPALIEEVDHVFFYAPGMSVPTLSVEKLNGERLKHSERSALFLERRPRQQEKQHKLTITLPEGIRPDAASCILSEALAAHYSGFFQIDAVTDHA